jgi:AraC-like DNA-binding protein
LDQWPERLQSNVYDPLLRDACLLTIQSTCHAPAGADQRLPEWLQDALKTFDHLPYLKEGIPALVPLTGRSREHCSRVVKERLGITLRDLDKQKRLSAFRRQLMTTQHPISAIAAELWPGSPTSLYRSFKATFGATPKAWREQHNDRALTQTAAKIKV